MRFEGEIGIAEALDLRKVLLEALASSGAMRISLEAATSMDVTAVQLLWALEREAKASGMDLTLEGPVPESLSRGLREAGFERFPFAHEPANEVR
jgi:anti-anti-sigma regulatory factor